MGSEDASDNLGVSGWEAVQGSGPRLYVAVGKAPKSVTESAQQSAIGTCTNQILRLEPRALADRQRAAWSHTRLDEANAAYSYSPKIEA